MVTLASMPLQMAGRISGDTLLRTLSAMPSTIWALSLVAVGTAAPKAGWEDKAKNRPQESPVAPVPTGSGGAEYQLLPWHSTHWKTPARKRCCRGGA